MTDTNVDVIFDHNTADQVVITTRACVVCSETTNIAVDAVKAQQWRSKSAHVQEIWPHVSADHRELAITGTHPACWTALFGEEEAS